MAPISIPRTQLFTPDNIHYISNNQAAITISHHPEFNACTKHIDITYDFLHDLISTRTINTIYVNTHDNLADIFMKGLSQIIHQDLTHQIEVIIPEN